MAKRGSHAWRRTVSLACRAASEQRFASLIRKTRTCWLWIGRVDRDGYGRFGLKSIPVHRIIWRRADRKIPRGHGVLHKCDVRNCTRLSHLYTGTNQRNTKDRHERGRSARGEHHGMARLASDQVIMIRRLAALTTENYLTLAKAFSVTSTTIGRIVRGENWRDSI